MKRHGHFAALLLATLLLQGCFEGKSSSEAATAASSFSSATASSPASTASSEHSSAQTSSTVSEQGGTSSQPSGTSSSSEAATSASSQSSSTPALQSLELSIPLTELPENNETVLTVTATYSDGTTGKCSTDIVWQIDNPDVVEISSSRLLAKAEGTATIWAEVSGKRSPAKSVTVYKLINGHRLPPEPDEKLNNATLLGIDSNSNGVRDDVERWTILKYRDKHPIVTLIGLQGARAAQIIIQEPEKARETRKYFSAAVDCAAYFQFLADINDEPILIDEYIFGDDFKSIQFNTTKRARAFALYNAALSGGVYGIPASKEAREKCNFNVTEMLKSGQ